MIDSLIDENTSPNLFYQKWIKFVIWFKKIYLRIIGLNVPQRLFRLYVLIILCGAFLLSSPCCLQVNANGMQINGYTGSGNFNFMKALFIACSGFSDTGLTPVPIYSYLNIGGQIVLLILIEIGGIGVLTLFYYVWNFFRHKKSKVDVGQLYLMSAERCTDKLSNSWNVMKKAVSFILICQLFFMIIYTLCFYFMPSYNQFISTKNVAFISYDDKSSPTGLQGNFLRSLWTGLFTSVSALNNAGFDNISSSSMAPFRNDCGTIFQFFIIIELIIGGLGHFVWFEIIEKIRKRKFLKQKHRISLYSKIAIIMYFIVAALGIIFAFSFEFTDPTIISNSKATIVGNTNSNGEFGIATWYNKSFTIIFNVFNCRSLGMETIKNNIFVGGAKWTFVSLMFIGASPGSTAGGIRTTTFAILLITVFSKLKGRKNVTIFRYRIDDDIVLQSFIIFFVAFALLIIGVLVLYTSAPLNIDGTKHDVEEYLVECVSAFGTAGLSCNITANARWWGLLYLIILMFVGQLGIFNTLLSWTKIAPRYNSVEYVPIDIKIN